MCCERVSETCIHYWEKQMIRTTAAVLLAGLGALPAAAHHEAGFIPGHPALILALLSIPVLITMTAALKRTRTVQIRRHSDRSE